MAGQLFKGYFNPIVNIIAKQKEKPKVPPHKGNTNAGTIDEKITDIQIVCWLCNQPHRLMESEKFIKKNIQERK